MFYAQYRLWEIVIVVVIALLIFGPKKLPDLGSSLGRSITGFKKGLKETKDDVTVGHQGRRDRRHPAPRSSGRCRHCVARDGRHRPQPRPG